MMGENILIIGAGGHGSEIHSYIQDLTIQDNGLRLIGFIDEHKASGPWQGTEILGDLNVLKTLVGHQAEVNCLYITALGSNRLRREIVRKLDSLSLRNLSAWTLRHPDAVVGRRNEIGEGTCLAPSSIVTKVRPRAPRRSRPNTRRLMPTTSRLNIPVRNAVRVRPIVGSSTSGKSSAATSAPR